MGTAMHVVPPYSAAVASHKSVVNVAMSHWRGKVLPIKPMRLIIESVRLHPMTNIFFLATPLLR
jgi:hypothetical protein